MSQIKSKHKTKFRHRPGKNSTLKSLQCGICYSDMKKCLNCFHVNCPWHADHGNCDICQMPVLH